jgi:hypothetical protein
MVSYLKTSFCSLSHLVLISVKLVVRILVNIPPYDLLFVKLKKIEIKMCFFLFFERKKFCFAISEQFGGEKLSEVDIKTIRVQLET